MAIAQAMGPFSEHIRGNPEDFLTTLANLVQRRDVRRDFGRKAGVTGLVKA